MPSTMHGRLILVIAAEHQRNQYLIKWASILVMRQQFRSVQFNYMPVGHTHMLIDQRFSIIATALGRQATLENPEDERHVLNWFHHAWPHLSKQIPTLELRLAVVEAALTPACVSQGCSSPHPLADPQPSFACWNFRRRMLLSVSRRTWGRTTLVASRSRSKSLRHFTIGRSFSIPCAWGCQGMSKL